MTIRPASRLLRSRRPAGTVLSDQDDGGLHGLRREVWLALGLALVLSLFVDVAMLVVPIYDMQLYDRVIQSHSMETLVALSVACVAGLGLYAAVDFLRGLLLSRLAERVAGRLHLPILHAAIRSRGQGHADAGADAVRDLHVLQGFLSSGAVATPLDALCAPLLLAVLFMLHPAYGFLGVCGIAIILLLGLAADALGRPGVLAATRQRMAVAQSLSSRLGDPAFAEALGMLPAIARRWAREQGQALGDLRRAGGRAEMLAGAARLARLLLQAGVMAMGASMILAHVTTPGSLMGANLLLNKLLNPFDHLVASWRHWGLAHAAWQRTATLLSRAAPVRHEAEPARTPLLMDNAYPSGPDNPVRPGGLYLRDVTLRAGGRSVLSGVSFSVPAGCVLGVGGPNGSGKSSLLRLIAGVSAPDEGSILLDGALVAACAERIGFLPQSVDLLDGSIADNVMRFAPSGPAGTRAVIQACRDAGIHETIGRLRFGYDAQAGSSQASLSGGQQQRIGLARALFAAPRLLLLDEPDASLDHEGEAALLRAVEQARDAGAIVVVVTHRPALLAAADLRLELRDGRVASFGAPARALQNSSLPGALPEPVLPGVRRVSGRRMAGSRQA